MARVSLGAWYPGPPRTWRGPGRHHMAPRDYAVQKLVALHFAAPPHKIVTRGRLRFSFSGWRTGRQFAPAVPVKIGVDLRLSAADELFSRAFALGRHLSLAADERRSIGFADRARAGCRL